MRLFHMVFTLMCASAALAQSQQPLYQQPGHPGRWSLSPASPPSPPPARGGVTSFNPRPHAGSGEFPIDSTPAGRLIPPKPATPRRNPSLPTRSDHSFKPQRDNPGRDLWSGNLKADIDGFNELYRAQQSAKAAREYNDYVHRNLSTLQTYFDERPFTLEELEAKFGKSDAGASAAPGTSTGSSDDARHAEGLKRSGKGLVIHSYMDQSQVQQLMRERGISASTGSTKDQAHFHDHYRGFMEQEREYYRKLVENGRATTEKMAAAAIKAAEGLRDDEDALRHAMGDAPEGERPPPLAKDDLPSSGPPPPNSHGEFSREYDEVRDRVNEIVPASPTSARLKDLASRGLSEAQTAYGAGDVDGAHQLLEAAKELSDFAVGLDPATGFLRSLYESATGSNLITGEALSGFERGFAAVGVLTAGTSAELGQAFKVIQRFGGKTESLEKIIALAEKTGQKIPHLIEEMKSAVGGINNHVLPQYRAEVYEKFEALLTKTMDKLQVERILNSQSANDLLIKSPIDRPPFQHWAPSILGSTQEETKFLRFSEMPERGDLGRSGPVGRYMLHHSEVEDLRNLPSTEQFAEAVQKRFSLPSKPNYITDVVVSKDTSILAGPVGKNFGRKAGALQYVLVNPDSKTTFENTRKLGDWLK